MKSPQTQHIFSNTLQQWIISAVIFVVLYAFFMWYHMVRGKPYSLLTTEKCIAIASVFCLGFALVLGPLSRFLQVFIKALPYRRSLGLMAAYTSVFHVLLCLCYLPFKFPDKYSEHFFLSWYLSHWLMIAVGTIALVLFLAIALYSYPSGVEKLGIRKWMILQKFSYLLVLLVVIHLLASGKVPGWIEWLKTFNKPLPPGGFTTTVFCAVVLLLKLVDMIVHGDTISAQVECAKHNTGVLQN